jgi:hypothetical protein
MKDAIISVEDNGRGEDNIYMYTYYDLELNNITIDGIKSIGKFQLYVNIFCNN